MNALDLFSDRPMTYTTSVWLFNTTQGVISFGPHHDTLVAAEEALTTFSDLSLEFLRDVIENGVTTFASEAFDQKKNFAIVLRVETGDVVSRALIPDGWAPLGHPLRR